MTILVAGRILTARAGYPPRAYARSLLVQGPVNSNQEVTLSPEQQARLRRLAQERGTVAPTLARDAIERLLDYDEWFGGSREGLSQVDSGRKLTHDEVSLRLKKHLTGKPPCPLMELRWAEEAAKDLERIADYRIKEQTALVLTAFLPPPLGLRCVAVPTGTAA